ncbi:protein FAM114A2 [Venturia canescens]|uniref:protein FAM114A2 n=1 Tax=Venturia canescens TaxID=32260 RepID=UPI001C9D4D9B|nr:protein FAM114A2 [Venturia canescens]
MATSDSDDFESADEELVADDITTRKSSNQRQWQNTTSTIGSDSDDDNECMPVTTKNLTTRNSGNCSIQSSGQGRRSRSNFAADKHSSVSLEPPAVTDSSTTENVSKIIEKTKRNEVFTKNKFMNPREEKDERVSKKLVTQHENSETWVQNQCKNKMEEKLLANEACPLRDARNKETIENSCMSQRNIKTRVQTESNKQTVETLAKTKYCSLKEELDAETTKKAPVTQEIGGIAEQMGSTGQKEERFSRESKREKVLCQMKSKDKEANLGTKKLGSKITGGPISLTSDLVHEELKIKALAHDKEPPVIEECWEFDEEETAKILKGLNKVDKVKMPEELRSEKKFKEIFKPDGWEGLDDKTILSEFEDNDKTRSALPKMREPENSGWGSWGSWGVASLLNSATAGVTTLTSHVTHGLTLLDEAMGAPTPEELIQNNATNENSITDINESSCLNDEIQPPQVSFGFNDLLSGVSSITKLVETTSSKVISGGLETLETIGKKTMEVLQEGDPGLKKKRAFFSNESDKPILSQMLREAKEKAEAEEKSLEEKQLSRQVHFESLFDDFQGLVHLEALEMLSKQCNMKIQQRLVTLDADELASIQETLQEVKELCDLGDEEEEEEEEKDEGKSENDLEQRLKTACQDLGISINYDKLEDIWKDTKTYLTNVSSDESTVVNRQVFQMAVSTLARFTAFSVERFHKTAELLLVKERRSTVNEADALVQLTRILSGQIGIAANMFSNWLNERIKKNKEPDTGIDITTIFLEAANASSYIQDAFRLLIPILQVGAI